MLEKFVGTWNWQDEMVQGTSVCRWDPAGNYVICQDEAMPGGVRLFASRLIGWDGVSEDEIVMYEVGPAIHDSSRLKIVSDTVMEGEGAGVWLGNKYSDTLRWESQGADQFSIVGTLKTDGSEPPSTSTTMYTRLETTDDEQDLIQVQQEWSRAEVAGDVRTVDRILADEYVLTLSDGTLMPKAEYLRDIQSEDTRSIAMSVEGTKVRLYGDMALVKGIVKWTEPGGKKHEDLFSETWLKRDGRWQCLATQQSEIETTVDSAKLSPEMKKLEVWVGRWEYEGEQVDPPVAGLPYGGAGTFSGTITYRFVLGGRFLEGKTEDHNPSGTTTSVELEGYDPKAANYVSSTFDSEGSMATSLATVSADGRTWTARSTMTTSAGDKVPVRSVTTFSPDGMRYTGTTEVSTDGGQTWKHWYGVKGKKARD